MQRRGKAFNNGLLKPSKRTHEGSRDARVTRRTKTSMKLTAEQLGSFSVEEPSALSRAAGPAVAEQISPESFTRPALGAHPDAALHTQVQGVALQVSRLETQMAEMRSELRQLISATAGAQPEPPSSAP